MLERFVFQTTDMQYYAGHEEKDILPIAAKLLELVKVAPTAKHQVCMNFYEFLLKWIHIQ
jgi:hypothetical protein